MQLFKQACRISLSFNIGRYLMSNAAGRQNGAEKSLMHTELCTFYVAAARGVDEIHVRRHYEEDYKAVHRATQALTDNLDTEIGFPLDERPDYGALEPLFFERFHELAMQALGVHEAQGSFEDKPSQPQAVFNRMDKTPEMDNMDYGYPQSDKVLGLYWHGAQAVVYASQVDDEAPDVITWRTGCSEGWDVTGQLVGWMTLPEPLLEPIAPDVVAALTDEQRQAIELLRASGGTLVYQEAVMGYVGKVTTRQNRVRIKTACDLTEMGIVFTKRSEHRNVPNQIQLLETLPPL